jgi:hypothetical protein
VSDKKEQTDADEAQRQTEADEARQNEQRRKEEEQKRRQQEEVARREPPDWVDFYYLQTIGVIPNWQTLRAWQKDPKIGFPLGRLLGPNSRRWNWHTEIAPWLASRPTDIKQIAANKNRKRRKKKSAARQRVREQQAA